MNTNNSQSKKEAGSLTKLSIFYLNQQEPLKQGTHSHILTWQRNSLGHRTSRSINVLITITGEQQTVTVRYLLEKRGARKDFAYNINLTKKHLATSVVSVIDSPVPHHTATNVSVYSIS